MENITEISPYGMFSNLGFHTKVWDEKGKTRICQICVSHGKYYVHSIQFVYAQGTSTVLSEKHGENGDEFETITLDYPLEFLTHVSGWYGRSGISTITFGTNRTTYGPFGKEEILSSDKKFAIKFRADEFFGFHGASAAAVLFAIGVYLKPSVCPSTTRLPTSIGSSTTRPAITFPESP